MYGSMFNSNLFDELDRLQRDVQRLFDAGPNIRGAARGRFPALNVGATPQSVELYAFVPGLDPAGIDVSLERGVLTIAGERKPDLPSEQERVTLHVNERFAGRFRKVVSLPDDVDPDGVTARYRDGVLHVSVKRRAAVEPRRIVVE